MQVRLTGSHDAGGSHLKKLVSAIATILLALLALNGPATASDGFTYQQVGKQSQAPLGLTVTLTSYVVTEKAGSVQLAITYTQANQTANQKLDEGSFKLFFTDGTSEPQYGLFNSLFPGDTNSRSYTWEWVKGKQPWLIEWQAGFFAKEPSADGLKWKIGDAYPTSSQPPSSTPSQGGLLYSLEAANYNSSTGQWANSSGINSQFLISSAAASQTFPAKGSSPTSVVFDGVSGHQFIAAEQYSNPQSFSLEVWFTTKGSGKLIGFEGSTNLTQSFTYDRHLYVGTDGKLYFGVFSIGAQVVASSKPVNDGKWHHAVAAYSAGTAQLYLDGALIQTKNVGAAEGLSGYWRIGGNRLAGWPSGVDGFFAGQIGEVRILKKPMSASEVEAAFSKARNTYGASSAPAPEPATPAAAKPTVVNGVTYQPIGVKVKSSNGLIVTVSDAQLTEKSGSTQLRVTYSQTNGTTKTQLNEGSFRLFFTDGTSLPQYGFFGSLFPGDSKDRVHTFEWTKGKKPWLLEWESDFFASKPAPKTLKWKIGPDYPTVSPKKYKNCAELNGVYPGGVAKSSKWTNKGSALQQRPAISTKVYDLNRSLDRDKDGLACER